MEKENLIMQNFAFDVMYENLECSKIPLTGQKPVGIIFGSHLITLNDSPSAMNWEAAMDYCHNIKIGGYACSAGNVVFWQELMSDKKKRLLDILLLRCRGEALGRMWRWTLSEYDRKHAYKFSPQSTFPFSLDFKDNGCHGNYVRPVLDLENLSL
ncbi:MAG: hypothetical protein Q4F75_00315 [Pseudomonadota bacterium]|nr:hypothetical protein [Pseudomonadota bacterium]